MTATRFEPLVPIAEFGVSAMTSAQLDAWAEVAGVTVKVDYLDRACVSLSDAYRLAEARREAEERYRAAESERRIAHATAVAELRAAITAEFVRVANATIATGEEQSLSPAGSRADALNLGLRAARARWAVAPVQVRQEVQHVDVPNDDGGYDSYSLGVGMPLDVVTSYAHSAARRA